ncbi:Aldehyde/histidinol dehydrogenase [Kockovaella imperatae]|uniref:Succinate-semialdehyde dehydrogenase n=1 Tax=Kockovaella imperatae TaxID=4999 RepID=A0A1Y1UP62_9TREE|nr:Aldehyde/histidinol dehydrogenase [Kockovaella imperatae]ORX39809.1 Aldehyde/histidinol dehydrogenase [Kockovaella imperatae]
MPKRRHVHDSLHPVRKLLTRNITALRTPDTMAAENLRSLLKDPELLQSKAYVNGQWVDADDGETFTVTNPATGKTLVDVPNMPQSQVRKAIEHAKSTIKSWSAETAYKRQTLLLAWYSAIMANVDDLALILTKENGKPLAEAKTEITYGASYISWFAAEAVRAYGHTVPAVFPGTRNTVIKQPIGVCGMITPWNFPNAMITRKAAPALAAGCTIVIKAPAETPLSALAICALAERVGIPAGVVNVVTVAKGEREQACGLELTTNPLVSKISFTGSTPVGRLLMKQCSSTLKKMSMELGGNAAFIVFDDADLDLAIEGVITSKFRGAGQTCVCANRIFVHAKVYNEFASRLTDRVKAFKVGDPSEEGVTIGPLITEAGVAKVERHVNDAVEKGARILVGGSRPDAPEGSFFYSPTVLADVPRECAVASEETFGPLAALFKFEQEEDVVTRANDTEVGLAGYFFTKDISRVWRVAERLEVGMVAVNTGMISQACIPFGGVKQSGFGREGGRGGLDEYMVEKLVTIGGIA